MVDSDPHDGPNQLRNDQSSQINKFQSMDSGEEDAPTELEMRGIREELPPIDAPKDLPIHCDEVGVHRLPVELLEQTFCYLPYLDHLPGTSKSCPQYDWIAITEVCKHWHDVAVNCRDLWTLIPLINEKLAQAALARSSSAEIRIVAIARGRLELNIGSEPSLAATRAALRHLSRTRELVLDQLCYDFRTAAQTAWDIEKVLDLLESNAATSLRTLYITSRSFMTIPEEIFKGEMPRLTSVTLDRCLLPHSTFSRAPITSLSISRTHINGDEREFLLILENMPLLQYLDIRGVIYMSMPRTDEPPKFALRPIHLPHLRRLSVGERLSVFSIIFLNSVIFPPSCDILAAPRMSLRLGGLAAIDNLSPTIVDSIAASMARIRSKLAVRYSYALEMGLSFDKLSILNANTSDTGGKEVVIDAWTDTEYDPDNLLPKHLRFAFSTYYNLHPVSVDYVDAIPAISGVRLLSVALLRRDWRVMEKLYGLKDVEHIHLRQHAVYSLFSILKTPREHAGDNAPFPKLASICIEAFDFFDTEDFFDMLLEGLEAWASASTVPCRVSIRDCDISDEMLRRLQRATGGEASLNWDGRCNGLRDPTTAASAGHVPCPHFKFSGPPSALTYGGLLE